MTTPLTVFEIPLISLPQQLQIALSGTNYVMRLTWCWPVECWMLDIYDGNTQAPLVLGAAVVTGADLLQQLRYLGILGRLVVQTDHDSLTQPTFGNLGQLSHLYYVPLNQGA